MTNLKKILKLISLIAISIFCILTTVLVGALLPIPGNYKLLTVLSGSMRPAIDIGSVVVVMPQKEYKTGDIITFDSANRANIPTTHRIDNIQIVNGAPVYTTKGDANKTEDGKKRNQSEIEGKVIFTIPYLGYVLDFMKKPLGLALLIFIPALLIIWKETKNIYRELEKKAHTKAASTANNAESNDQGN